MCKSFLSKIYPTVVLILLNLTCLAQRDTLQINSDWSFKIDKEARGINDKWYLHEFENAKNVQLPHTWNVETENQNHYGWGWYQKKIFIPKNWKSKNAVIRFGAINHTSIIYVNGVKINEQIGDGFNEILLPLNNTLIYGKENLITVFCNNDFGKEKVPFGSSFDWANDGGIIRKVSLIISGKPAASYLHASPILNLVDQSGKINFKVGFANADKKISFSVVITEENQKTKNIIFSQKMKPVWNNGHDAIAEIDLKKVNPWHFDFPNLYRVDVKVLYGNVVVDQISTNIGFRDIKMLNGQFFLNGEHVKLMGVEWTAGSNPNYGFAEPPSEIIRHGKLMKDVNAIFSRQHFQQDELFYDFCDRNGILVQQEIPLWGGETPSNPTIEKIAHQQLTRMIFAHYNHPSIFSWGMGNELNGRNEQMKRMIQGLIDSTRKLDPTRNVAYVSNTLTQGFINSPKFVPDAGSLGDYIMMNEYGGSWWKIPTGQIHSYLDSIHMSYPDKTFFISEFGLCEPNFRGGDERRIEDLIYHMAIYEGKPYVEGAIYFDLTDYRTHYPGTAENDKFRRRIHGVYDMYGKPKPSMKVLRELSSPVEVQGLSASKKGKMNVSIFGSMGLPQHIVKGYKVYISEDSTDYLKTTPYDLPELKPGQHKNLEVDDKFKGRGVVTVVRPTGYVASQKVF